MHSLGELRHWDSPSSSSVAVLEAGEVLFAPNLHFEVSERERHFLSPACLDGKSKNVSYRRATGVLHGATCR